VATVADLWGAKGAVASLPKGLSQLGKTCYKTQFLVLHYHTKINSGWGFAPDPTGGGYNVVVVVVVERTD